MSRCTCQGVEFGSYDAAVLVPMPDCMRGYRDRRVAAGLSPNLAIDACILGELQELWRRGVRTTGSCCGHGKTFGFVSVVRADAEIMRTLGYRELDPEHTCCPENQGLEFYLTPAPGTKLRG